ncbi:MAG TPA: hypothetical protein VGO40_12455 [Longimicrobium sp.]|jgi:hypothetical protein|nr:hypothetical protein [Longimicrobium sp.]
MGGRFQRRLARRRPSPRPRLWPVLAWMAAGAAAAVLLLHGAVRVHEGRLRTRRELMLRHDSTLQDDSTRARLRDPRGVVPLEPWELYP